MKKELINNYMHTGAFTNELSTTLDKFKKNNTGGFNLVILRPESPTMVLITISRHIVGYIILSNNVIQKIKIVNSYFKINTEYFKVNTEDTINNMYKGWVMKIYEN